MELAKLSPEELKRVNRRIDRSSAPFVQYKNTRSIISDKRHDPEPATEVPQPSVKDMPAFDPDAEVSSLALTIPSWSSSIKRTHTTANLSIISPYAKKRLLSALETLEASIDELRCAIKEEP